MPAGATVPRANLDSARSGLSKMVLGAVYAAVLNFAGGLYGETFIFLTPTPGLGGPAVHSGDRGCRQEVSELPRERRVDTDLHDSSGAIS